MPDSLLPHRSRTTPNPMRSTRKSYSVAGKLRAPSWVLRRAASLSNLTDRTRGPKKSVTWATPPTDLSQAEQNERLAVKLRLCQERYSGRSMSDRKDKDADIFDKHKENMHMVIRSLDKMGVHPTTDTLTTDNLTTDTLTTDTSTIDTSTTDTPTTDTNRSPPKLDISKEIWPYDKKDPDIVDLVPRLVFVEGRHASSSEDDQSQVSDADFSIEQEISSSDGQSFVSDIVEILGDSDSQSTHVIPRQQDIEQDSKDTFPTTTLVKGAVQFPPRSTSLAYQKPVQLWLDPVTPEDSIAPPVPAKSRLRSFPKAVLQFSNAKKEIRDRLRVRELLRKVEISRLRSHLSSMVDIYILKDRHAKKTEEERRALQRRQDFLEGKARIYKSIIHARERAETEGESVQWLRFDDGLAADARVTADEEEIRAQRRSNASRRSSEFTRIEVVEESSLVKLIGPAGYGAFTLGEMWVGGLDKRHIYDSHKSARSLEQEHDESCSCMLYLVFQTITDQSYKYIGIAQSRFKGQWIVYLAKEPSMKQATNAPKIEKSPHYTARFSNDSVS